jgi:plasmid stabilization system protein ParE
MASKVIWLRAALADLEEIGNTIGANSPAYATIVVSKLYDATQDLKHFPRMGRRVPEWDDDKYRERIVYSYRVIYRIVSDERIELLGFIHGARLLPDEVRERQP